MVVVVVVHLDYIFNSVYLDKRKESLQYMIYKINVIMKSDIARHSVKISPDMSVYYYIEFGLYIYLLP
jgi:hypothetical protein